MEGAMADALAIDGHCQQEQARYDEVIN